MNNLDKLRFLGVFRNKVFIGPKTVSMHITNICNLRCIYCWYHSPLKKDYGPKDGKKKEMDYRIFKEIIDDCYSLKVERIQLSAQGEPSLHSHFVDMLDYAKGKGFAISLVSNGTFSASLLRHVLKVDEITIDLSAADSQSYMELQSRDSQYLFNVVMKNLGFFSALKNKKKKTPYIKVNYILNSKNYRNLPNMFKLISKFKVDKLNILNIDTVNHNSEISITSQMAKNIEKSLDIISKEKYFLEVNSNVQRNHLLYSKFLNTLNLDLMQPSACYHGWYYAFITLNGDVTPCCKMKNELIAGNVYRSSFKEIWYSKEFNEIRFSGKKNLYNKKFGGCYSCCFYGLNQDVHNRLKHQYNA